MQSMHRISSCGYLMLLSSCSFHGKCSLVHRWSAACVCARVRVRVCVCVCVYMHTFMHCACVCVCVCVFVCVLRVRVRVRVGVHAYIYACPRKTVDACEDSMCVIVMLKVFFAHTVGHFLRTKRQFACFKMSSHFMFCVCVCSILSPCAPHVWLVLTSSCHAGRTQRGEPRSSASKMAFADIIFYI